MINSFPKTSIKFSKAINKFSKYFSSIALNSPLISNCIQGIFNFLEILLDTVPSWLAGNKVSTVSTFQRRYK